MQDTMTRKVGIPPNLTGLPFTVWLLREKPGRTIPMIMATPDPAYEEDRSATFVIEPTLVQVGGPEMNGFQCDILASWVAQNGDLIMDYWEGRSVKIVPRLRRVVSRS